MPATLGEKAVAVLPRSRLKKIKVHEMTTIIIYNGHPFRVWKADDDT